MEAGWQFKKSQKANGAFKTKSDWKHPSQEKGTTLLSFFENVFLMRSELFLSIFFAAFTSHSTLALDSLSRFLYTRGTVTYRLHTTGARFAAEFLLDNFFYDLQSISSEGSVI